ncbi:MAG: hypothetical protein ACYC6Y_30090, partial [Thermoguttaceae bacterium]
AGLDYLDAHSYFHHPTFPGRPWDPQDWFVSNVALVNADDGGTLTGLAARRVAGMPYTVSEYNHPAPISYAAEGFPMIAAFGRFQKWDGIFSFAYSHNQEFTPRKISSFFDFKGDPGKMAHHIACAALFLRGDVAEARETVEAGMDPKVERELLHRTMTARGLTATGVGLDPREAMRHAVALNLRSNAEFEEKAGLAPREVVSDTGQLRWDFTEAGAGYFIADTPRTRLFTGFVRGRTFPLGDSVLKIGKTNLDWATITVTAIDAQDLKSPGRILLAATGDIHNSDAQLEELGGGRVTLRNRWGEEPVLCEGVEASLTLPVDAGKVRLFSLDESGARKDPIPVRSADGKTILEIGPQYKTIWYEIQIAP